MISKEEVQHLADLARLELGDNEVESLRGDINNILDYVGQVSSVAGSGDINDAPLLHNVMRDDTPRASTSSGLAHGDIMAGKEEALRAAFPKREGGFNVVRKIIEKGE